MKPLTDEEWTAMRSALGDAEEEFHENCNCTSPREHWTRLAWARMPIVDEETTLELLMELASTVVENTIEESGGLINMSELVMLGITTGVELGHRLGLREAGQLMADSEEAA